MRLGHKIKRVFALSLSVLTISSAIIQPVYADSSYYRSSLGTNLALGSPLSNSDFSADDWDKWEMVAFGIFMGNYCQIGVDDYNSAFKSGSKGLEAMQFAAGGDVNSNGILRKMINVATTAQQANLSQIQVRYNYWSAGEDTQLDLGMRGAKLKDLFPTIQTGGLWGDKEGFEVKPSSQIERPIISASLLNTDLPNLSKLAAGNFKAIQLQGADYWDGSLSNSYNVSGHAAYFWSGYNGLMVGLPSNALLPQFTISVNGQLKEIFNFEDGYDAQLMSSVIAKMSDNMSDDEFKDILNANPDLKFDAFGNICAMYNGKPIVIIPAAANKNIQKDKEVNILNSLIVNGLMVGNSDSMMKVKASESYPEDETNILPDDITSVSSMNGMPAVADTGDMKPGKLIMYSDTDPLMFEDLYKSIKNKNSSIATSTQEFIESSGYIRIGQDSSATGDISLNADEQATVVRDQMGNSNTKSVPKFSDLSLGSYINKVVDGNSLYSAPFKIEMTGVSTKAFNFTSIKGSTEEKDAVYGAQIALSFIGNMFSYYLPENSLTDMMLVNGGSSTNSVELISSYYYITPALSSNMDNEHWFDSDEDAETIKDFGAYALANISNSSNGADSSSLRGKLKTLKEPKEIFKLLMCKDESEYSTLGDNIGSVYKTFIQSRYNIKTNKDFTGDTIRFGDTKDYLNGVKSSVKSLYDGTPLEDNLAYLVACRICKVYKPSAAFEAVSKIYDLDNSALFSEYTTGMYISYLDWYGILDNKTDEDLRFDTTLFEGKDYLNLDPDDLIDSMSDEEKEKVIKNKMFLLFDLSEAGRAFRVELFGGILSGLFDSAYEKSSAGDGLGFLNVSGYKDNMLTSALIENYERFADILVGIMFLLVIIQGILNRRSLSWFFTVELAVLLSVGVIPTYVEIAPYLCNTVIQKAFQDNALYWLAEEEISNTAQAEDMKNDANDMAGLTEEEERQAVVMMNSLRVQQSDSSLLVKLDTSKKVIEQINIGWEKLQQCASTRWLVPNLIQQISGDNGTYDYVYISTYDWLNNMTRGYLASLTGGQQSGNSSLPNTSEQRDLAEAVLADRFYTGEYTAAESQLTTMTLEKKQNHFNMYRDTSDTAGDASKTYKSVTRLNTDTNHTMAHTFIYMMSKEHLIGYISSGKTADSPITTADWDKLAENPGSYCTPTNFVSYNTEVLEALNSYNRYDKGMHPSFTNLWSTENIGLYFYALVKDTLPISRSNTEYITHQLAGGVAEVTDADGNATGEKVRTSFMHQGETGYVRDFLDLEEVFTNMLPYLYAEQIIMGGTDGKSGVLGDSLMGDQYEIYSENLQSWLYRSNWVTKIMSDARYSSEAEVAYYAGDTRQTVKISNMVDPRSYPTERPMVFSEAQQKALGLSDGDLNLLELKLVRINDEVCDEWTKLVNYANLEGMTAETMERLMTTVATLKFNEIITRTSIFDTTMSQYPKHLDMRNITWDALMRHMLVSSSKNSTYLTTNSVISSIMDSCGILVSAVALIISAVNASAVPFVRDILLSLMLLFTILSVILNLYKGAKEKTRASVGWALTYLLFGAYTAFFYYLIAKLVGNGNTAEILVNNMQSIDTSSITFKLFTIAILDFIYIYGLWHYMKNIVFKGGLNGLKAYMQDGGFNFFHTMAGNMTRGINRGLSGVTKSVRGVGQGFELYANNQNKVVPQNDPEGRTLKVTIDGGKVGSHPVNKDNPDSIQNTPDDTGYVLETIERTNKIDTESRKRKIDAEIAKGKQSENN